MARAARAIAILAPAVMAAACSIVAGLGPEPGPLPASADASPEASPEGATEGAPPDAIGDTPAAADGSSPTIGACRILPPDNPFNRDVSNDPIDTDAMTNIFPSMNGAAVVHPDWGDTINGFGTPFNVSQAPPVPINVTGIPAQTDPLACTSGGGSFCYPIPPDAKVEGSGDAHVIVLDTTGAPNDCTLYELYRAAKDDAGPGWSADHGAIFHLGSNALRPDGWISADTAGLPILPGLVRFEETSLGEIKHAIRFTMRNTFNGYIHPATHANGTTTTTLPAMGLRVRLRADFPTSTFSGLTLVILKAMKTYGMILADKGSDWYISGDRNDGWTAVLDDVVTQLRNVHGSDFQIVKSGAVSTTGL